jgi:hypothetical protein
MDDATRISAFCVRVCVWDAEMPTETITELFVYIDEINNNGISSILTSKCFKKKSIDDSIIDKRTRIRFRLARTKWEFSTFGDFFMTMIIVKREFFIVDRKEKEKMMNFKFQIGKERNGPEIVTLMITSGCERQK